MTESAPEPTIDIGGLRGPGDKFRPIQYDLKSELTETNPNQPYRIFAIKYTGENELDADGALFEVDPNSATPVMHITKAGYRARRQVVEGDGICLSILPSGDIHIFEVSANKGNILEQGAGWVDCWIAGPNGMKILDSSEPAFQLSFETPLVVDDPSLPARYWEKYRELTDRSK